MKKLKLIQTKSPSETIAYVLAVFVIVSILLTFAKIAEVVTESLSAVTGGKVNIPVPVMQSVAGNLAAVGAGLFLVLLGAVVAVPIVKVACIVAGIALVAITLRNVYRAFTNKPSETILPDNVIRKR